MTSFFLYVKCTSQSGCVRVRCILFLPLSLFCPIKENKYCRLDKKGSCSRLNNLEQPWISGGCSLQPKIESSIVKCLLQTYCVCSFSFFFFYKQTHPFLPIASIHFLLHRKRIKLKLPYISLYITPKWVLLLTTGTRRRSSEHYFLVFQEQNLQVLRGWVNTDLLVNHKITQQQHLQQYPHRETASYCENHECITGAVFKGTVGGLLPWPGPLWAWAEGVPPSCTPWCSALVKRCVSFQIMSTHLKLN